MKRFFYLLVGLILAPALLYAQGSLSLKDINDNLTNNYYNKTASDARYATTTYGYSSAEVDILLAPKADKTYVDATDEAIISDDDSQDVQIESNRVAIMLKASQTDMDSAEAVIQNILADDDSQDVTIEANKVGVASLEVGLQTHQNNPTGAHSATAISATWTNVQVSLDSIEATIQGIVVGSGFATEAWVNSTLETNFYTKAQTNATIEAAIAAIPSGGGTAIEDIGTYIESSTTWEFSKEYDTTAVCIYRNRIYQPRSLFTTVDVSSKTRVIFSSAIDASDEIILISNK